MYNAAYQLFARRNDEINQWLEKNPLVFGAIFGGIGAVILAFGVRALVTGVATDKWGNEHDGTYGKILGGIQTAAGLMFIGIALYKVLF